MKTYKVPNIILVGYGKEQIYAHECIVCRRRFFPDTDKDLVCDSCEEPRPIPAENLSTVNFRGTVIGWHVEFADYGKRSRYNFIKCMKRDGYQCQYCGYKPGLCPEYIPLSVDHITPFSKRGTNKMNNLATACMQCNLLAHNKLFADFTDKKAFILERREQKGLKRSWFRYVNELVELLKTGGDLPEIL